MKVTLQVKFEFLKLKVHFKLFTFSFHYVALKVTFNIFIVALNVTFKSCFKGHIWIFKVVFKVVFIVVF